MEYKIKVGNENFSLIHDDLDAVINVDDLTKIDTSNLFGESVTMSSVVNRVGLLKAEVGAMMANAKLQIKLFEGNFKAQLRKQASVSSGYYNIEVDGEMVRVKLSETGLSSSFENNAEWIKLNQAYIKAEKNFNSLDSLHWACQDKCRKLNGLTSHTTPDDYAAAMIEGKINGITIRKNK